MHVLQALLLQRLSWPAGLGRVLPTCSWVTGQSYARVALPLNMAVLAPSKARSARRVHIVSCCWHWILLPWWDSQEILFALTDELIIQNVHNRFSMGVSRQPVQSARDSEVLRPCLCSLGVVLNALLSLNQNRGLWPIFCCHEGGPHTLSSDLQT